MPPEPSASCCCIHCRTELAPGTDECEQCRSVASSEVGDTEDAASDVDELDESTPTVKRPVVVPLPARETMHTPIDSPGEEAGNDASDTSSDTLTNTLVPVLTIAEPVTPLPPTTDPITPLPPTTDPITPLPPVMVPESDLGVLISVSEDAHTQRPASLWERVRMLMVSVPVWLWIVVAALLTMLVQGYRLGVAPDIFSDEGVYFLVGANIAQGHGLIVDHSAFFWHPPLYMLIEAIYLKLAGLAYADPLTGVLAARYLNIVFAGCTTVVLILFGRKLHSYKAGFVIAAFFLLDPYVQRINRRNMLETLAMLCILLGLYFFLNSAPRLTRWQRIAAGVAFGAALLVKEAMFLELLVPVLYVVWCKRSQLRDLLWVVVTAGIIYLLYPLWSIVAGEWSDYLAYKSFGIDRVLVRLQNAQSTPTSSTITLVGSKGDLFDAILARLAQYGMSYLLIALAAVLAIVLLVRFRHVESAQYLAVWNIFSIGFGFVLGGVSDQYFYYLIVSSLCVIGYVLTLLLEGSSSTYAKNMLQPHNYWGQRFASVYLFLFRLLWRPLIAVLVIMLLVNSVTWTRTYALGSDDAYMSIVTYIKGHFPRGETIEASDDVAYYYLSSSYTIRLDRDPTTIVNMHVRYFILSSKDAQGGYDAMTPQLYNWVIAHSHALLVYNDLSFAHLGLYQLDTASSTQGAQAAIAVKAVGTDHEDRQIPANHTVPLRGQRLAEIRKVTHL